MFLDLSTIYIQELDNGTPSTELQKTRDVMEKISDELLKLEAERMKEMKS